MPDWIYSPDISLDVPAHLDTHVRWLLNSIYFSRVTTGREFEDYVPLHSRLLSLVFGGHDQIRPTRNACLEAGLIELDGEGYKPGVHSLRYRLGPALLGVKFTRWNIPGKRFAKRVREFRSHLTSTTELDEVGHHLRKSLELVKFISVGETLEELPHEKAELAREQIDVFEQGVVRAKRCEFGKRFHSNITGIVGEVRKHCLSFDGRTPLIEVDLACSQPYQLACMTSGVKYSSLSPYIPTHSIPSHSLSPYVSCFDFLEDVLGGVLYDRFQSAGGFESKGETKDKFFGEVYGKVHQGMPIFAELYPEVAEELMRMKSERGYKSVPQEMQRRESGAIIDGVCGRLMREYPNVPLITCHDSILCEEKDLDIILELIRWAHRGNPYQPLLRVNGEDV